MVGTTLITYYHHPLFPSSPSFSCFFYSSYCLLHSLPPPSLLHCPCSSFVYILIVLSWKSAILVYRMWSLRYLFFLYFFFLFLFLSLFFFAFIILFLFCSSSSSYLPDFLLLFLITSFQAHFAMWALIKSPLMLGMDMLNISKDVSPFSFLFSFPFLSFLFFPSINRINNKFIIYKKDLMVEDSATDQLERSDRGEPGPPRHSGQTLGFLSFVCLSLLSSSIFLFSLSSLPSLALFLSVLSFFIIYFSGLEEEYSLVWSNNCTANANQQWIFNETDNSIRTMLDGRLAYLFLFFFFFCFFFFFSFLFLCLRGTKRILVGVWMYTVVLTCGSPCSMCPHAALIKY